MCLCVQVLYIDADTLWLESMANMKDVFKEFAQREALFGIVVETTHVKASVSWYKHGRSCNDLLRNMYLLTTYCKFM